MTFMTVHRLALPLLIGLGQIMLLMVSAITAVSQEISFFDPDDSWFDMTAFLDSKYGFMPVPIIITEPAVGYGGGAALVYLHDRMGDVRKGEGKKGPPSISAIVGGATENGTWFAGGGHFGSWREDTMRYIGAAATASVTMDYYGLGGALKNPVEFDTDLFYTTHELLIRLAGTNFFLGGKYTFIHADNSFTFFPNLPIDVPALTFRDRQAALAVLFSYDNRDNILTPTRGMNGKIRLSQFHENLGGDDNFARYDAEIHWYQPLSSRFFLGLRARGEVVDGRAPFYLYPFIDMRGIKAMQYQGKKVVLAEGELRWNLYKRWSLVGFTGAGKAYGRMSDEGVWAKGVGFRYLAARGYGLNMGIDIAQGPDDTAFYIQFGGAWH